MALELLHRKESIILTTIEIIDELGIPGLSTREIAKRQGISEGTIFRHFKTKNDIILGVLQHFSQYDEDIIRSAELKELTPKEAVIYFIDSYATYYENYPAITAMTQMYDHLSYQPEFAAKISEIFGRRQSFLVKAIADGQERGEFVPACDAAALATVLNGTFREVCLAWRMGGKKFSLREKAIAAITMVMAAFAPKA